MSEALLATYARADLAFERGQGPYLYTSDGRCFLDFACGIAVTALGHSHPHLVEALRTQGARLWHCSNLYRIPEGERLAQRLAEHSFADRVFFCNSGAEAVECSIKLVRRFHHGNGHPERYRVLACNGAFHGRTLTTLSAAGNQRYLEGFGPPSEGFDHVQLGNLNELRAAITEQTGAVLVEPVQGEGGVRVAAREYLCGLRETCDEFGLLLILDEVQSGMGRTGKLFAHRWAGITPDVMALAKGLGSGFPIGACLATEEVAAAMPVGSHGSTFGGNPLAMAISNAVLDVLLSDGFLEHVQQIGTLLRQQLEDLVMRYPSIFADVRGTGLMLGLRCLVSNREMVDKLRDNGLLTAAAGDNVIRILPPLVIDETHAEEAVDILNRVCAGWSRAK